MITNVFTVAALILIAASNFIAGYMLWDLFKKACVPNFVRDFQWRFRVGSVSAFLIANSANFVSLILSLVESIPPESKSYMDTYPTRGLMTFDPLTPLGVLRTTCEILNK